MGDIFARVNDVWTRLCGVWRGEGAGSYPDIPPFRFLEETTISLAPDWSMLCVLQSTWRLESGVAGKGLHLETGIIQARDGGLIYSCAQDSGRTEVMRGAVTESAAGLRIDWVTIAHGFDDRLIKMGRTWWIDGPGSRRDSASAGPMFRYEAHLSTTRTPEYRKHLEASLRHAPPRA